MAQLLAALGLRAAGGNYNNMKRQLQRLGLRCEHWTGQAWNVGQQCKPWQDYSKATSIKPHLVKLRGHKCEVCKLSTWLSEKIQLEIHHKDGDRTNNALTNLQLLCPNCHSYTDTYKGRKRT